jgi:hypothetical protein
MPYESERARRDRTTVDEQLKIAYEYLLACIMANGGSITISDLTMRKLLRGNVQICAEEDVYSHSTRLFLTGHEGIKAEENSYERQILNE